MPCEFHGSYCAFQDWSHDRCEICHCDWVKITAPATRETVRQSFTKAAPGKPSEPVTVTDVAYLDGYGELPANHFWRHATDLARAEVAVTREAARRAARKQRAA